MCPAILKADQSKYVSRQLERDRVKYGNGLFTPLALLGALGARAVFGSRPNGMPSISALYLPRSWSEGLGDVITFLSNNASAFKDITGAVSAGVETAGKVAITTTHIIQRLRELRTQGMTIAAIQKVIEAVRFRAPATSGTNEASGVKEGAGFFYVDGRSAT